MSSTLQPLGSIVWRILESKGKYVSTNKEWGLKKLKTTSILIAKNKEQLI